MKANEHITREAFEGMIPKDTKFNANENAEHAQTYATDGMISTNIQMNDVKDVARINKVFLKNIGVMLPRIIDPQHVSRYKKKPANTALKYVINKNSKISK